MTGHGIGREFHISPAILHWNNNIPGRMVPGMVFTIEPPIIELINGHTPDIRVIEDNWTIVPVSSSNLLSSQYEETILIGEDGVELLTRVPYAYQNL